MPKDLSMEADKITPADRLDYEGSLDPVIKRLGNAYQIGEPTDFSVIGVGYEDCNVIITTPKEKYVAKIFSKDRTSQDITRYSKIMEKVVKGGVDHPPIIKTKNGKIIYVDTQANGISMVLMQFVIGKSFFELNRAPNEEELQKVLEQAAKVNMIDYKPKYLFESWAIPNIQAMFDRVKKFIKPEDVSLVKKAMTQHDEIQVDRLPHCFVHGDFTKANVLKGDDGKIYILDFSVANWYPRIQELAVIAANLLHDVNHPISLRDKCEVVADKYSKLNLLTPEERNHLYAYSLAGVAMEFMGAHQEKYLNSNDTEETEYWLNLGREGLKRELG
jgi:Ser/Thr protein kinase RdoA (MazF antagonist)